MSSKTKSAVRDVSATFRPAGVGMNPRRYWMGCGHLHTRGKLRHGMPWTCAACVEAKGRAALTDQRYTVQALPPGYRSQLDPRECRPWAQAAVGGRA